MRLLSTALKPEHLAPAGDVSRTVVICGSMIHFSAMVRIQQTLRDCGIESIAPEDERHVDRASLSQNDWSKLKRRMSERYFRIIRRRSVFGILVANYEKHGRPNYIGPNTLAEIAIAVNARKKIYLLHDRYKELDEELEAWGAISLNGDIGPLIRQFNDQLLLDERQLKLELPGM
jgi:hypothetical protein